MLDLSFNIMVPIEEKKIFLNELFEKCTTNIFLKIGFVSSKYSLNLNQWIVTNYPVAYFALIISEVQLKKKKYLRALYD